MITHDEAAELADYRDLEAREPVPAALYRGITFALLPSLVIWVLILYSIFRLLF